MFKKLLLFSGMVLSVLSAKAAYVPVPLTTSSYNFDAVCNGAGAATTSGTSSFDAQGYWLMDSTFNPGSGTTTVPAMPTSLQVTSLLDTNVKWQLKPYNGLNSLRIANVGTDSVVFQTPTAAAEVYVLYSNVQLSSTAGNVNITVNFTDGTTQTVNNFSTPNWFFGATPARIIGGRFNGNNSTYESNAAGPQLYQFKVTLLPANYSKTIRSIKFDNTLTNELLTIFAVSISTPCSGAVTAGAVASSTGTSACPSVNFTLSLPTATSGGGITYQWQSSATGGAPWTNITGANNSTYTASQTAVTTYRAYIACPSGSSDTSTPLTVTMKPVNQCYCVPTATTTSLYITNFTTTGATTNVNNTSAGGTTNGGYSDFSGTQTLSGMQTTTVNFTTTYNTTGGVGVAVFVDWNQDGDFLDANEKAFNTTSYVFTTSVSGSFTIPQTALPGNTRLRVMMDYNSSSVGSGPCNYASGSSGEAEDYTLNVIALPACVTPNQPTALVLSPGMTVVNVSFTASAPAADKYMIVRTPGSAPLNTMPANGTTYTVGNTLGNGTILSLSNSTAITDAGLTSGTTYTYTIIPFNDFCTGGPLYNTATPPSGTTTTASTAAVYTWNGSVSTNWTVAGNWTPARAVPDPADILQFNNGATNTVTNIPTQTVRRITFSNNTTANFQAPSAATLTIASDSVAATNELDIAAGSSLISNGTAAALTLAFSGGGGTANIAGTLESVSGGTVNVFNLSNVIATVTATGTITGTGTTGTTCFTNTSVTNLLINGTYKHNYTTSNGPGIPTASWNTGSLVLIAGYTTATGGPNGGLNQTFYNFTYNCPNQTASTNWSGTGPLTVSNNFTLTSTGTGTLQFAGAQAYTYVVNNYIQTGGILDLASASSTNVQMLNVSGTFTKSGGTLKGSGTSATSLPTLNFTGTTAQNVTFDAVPGGQIVYRISNPAGINLIGTGGLTTFNINNNGGVRISTRATNPINTTMTIAYGTSGTTLTYDTAGSYTMTANVFPTAAGPQNLTVNLGTNTNIITMPFSRTIPGTLTMTAGDIDLGSNTLTLGTSATAAGTLTYTNGNIRISTGSMVRWYGTSGLPTAAGTGVGYYPIAYGGANRNVALSFSAAGALTTGGTIGVGHTNASGFTNVSVADGAYTIDKRTNASWAFTTSGIVLGGSNTINMRLTGTALYNAINPANLRVMQAAAVVGTHVAGAGVSAQRSGLVVTDLAVPYYVGAAAVDIGGVYVAINTGNWSTGSTWDIGTAPGVANDAYINSGVTVTVDAATNTAKSLNILAGGTLTANANTLTLDSALQNNGIVNVGGGTLTVNGNSGLSGITNSTTGVFNLSNGTVNLGPAGGGSKPFTSAGILTVSGGTMNINGSFQLSAGATFNQSGGNINVDGNAGGVVANSVPASTKIVNILTQNLNLTDGVFTIVDPHVGSNTNTLEYNVGAGASAGGNHTFNIGNGVSTDTGNNASYAFSINTSVNSSGRFAFKHLVINSGSGANRYFVQGADPMGVLGNLTVNANSEFRQSTTSKITYIAGNLVNNGTYSALGTTYFANYINGTVSSATVAQTVSGAGTFRNLLTAPTGKFYKIQVNNNANVTFNIGDIPFSNSVVMTAATAGPSRLIMQGTSTLIELGGASQTASATAGWIVGRYQKTAGSTGGFNGTFPVGDLAYYSPVNIPTATVATTGGIWVSATVPDHPNIATSNIAATRSVNRYYTVQPVNGLTFTAGTVTITFNWNAADVDAGATPANFKVGRYANSTWMYPTTASPGATSIQATGLDTATAGSFIIGEACSPVNITTPPANQTICIGSPVTFSVTVTNPSTATYQWQKGTTNITGANSATYTIPATVAGDAGTYRVIVGGACPAVTPVTSTAATLTLNTPAAITTQPAAAQNICEGSPVTFSVAATGTGLTYQWKKGGSAITGATSASYTIPVVAPGDAGNYTVDVIGTAPCGTVTSSASVLTIKPLPLIITPASATNFCVGGSVVLNAPTTPSTLTYQWQNNNINITGQTGNAYTATTSGSYTAMITNTANGCTDTSNIILVSAAGAPQAIINPAGNASFCQGGSITLHGNNTAGLTYEWYLNGGSTPVGLDSTYVATAPGSYTLKVSIGAGCSTTSTATVVSVNALPTITTVPTGNQAICQNDTLTITALYNNATLVWRFNGNPITGATSNTYKATATGNYTVTATSTVTGCVNTSAAVTLTVNPLPTVTVISANAATFCDGGTDTLKASPTTGLTYLWYRNGTQITPAATGANYVATQSGSYTVVATSTTTGCSRTSAATTVTANPLPNVVITPSLGLNICQGQTTNLCVPTGTGLTYVWRNGGTPITGATSACYGANATGNYSVTVTNTSTGCSATSAVAAVTVSPIPTATATARGNTTACQGDTVWLDANIGANLTYQWRLNSNPIPGATGASYGAIASGAYTVTVTNGANCSVTSAIVNVTINPRPTATISYTTPVTFCEGGAVVLTGVSNTGITYQWQNNGAPISGATSNNYIASSTGSYSVIITNALGCSTVSPTILVVSNPNPVPVITRNGNILSTGTYATYQWYFNSQPIPGATNQSITVTQNGGYAVFVTDVNNCTNYSQVYFLNNVGVGGPLLSGASIKVFPNPVRNTLNIEAPAVVNVTIRDLTGREVMKVSDARQIDMSILSDGAYMLMISDKNGNMVKTDKVMKVSE